MNPRSVRQKVASGTICGLTGEQKFYFRDIPDKWFKVDVREADCPNTSLMFSDDDAIQIKVKDVVKGNTIWDGRYMKNAA
jgi:hypothetical protein